MPRERVRLDREMRDHLMIWDELPNNGDQSRRLHLHELVFGHYGKLLLNNKTCYLYHL